MITPEKFGDYVRLGNYVRGNTLANDRERVAYDIEQGDTVVTAASCAFSSLCRKLTRASRPIQISLEEWQKIGVDLDSIKSLVDAEEGAILQLAHAYESLGFQTYQWFLRNRRTVTIGDRIYFAHEPKRGQKGLYQTEAPLGTHDLTCLKRHSLKDILPNSGAVIPKMAKMFADSDNDSQKLESLEVIAHAGARIQSFGADILELSESSPQSLLGADERT